MVKGITKNKGFKQLCFSAVTLVIAFVLTVSVVFAWFALNSTPKTGSFKIEVRVEETMQVNLIQDAESYKSGAWNNMISSSQCWEVIKNLVDEAHNGDAQQAVGDGGEGDSQPQFSPDDFKIGATTTSDGIVFRGESTTNTIAPNTTSSATGEGGYVSFRINFRANSSFRVYLDKASSVSTPSGGISGVKQPVFAWDDKNSENGGKLNLSQYGLEDVEVDIGSPIFTSAAYATRFSFTDVSSYNDYLDKLEEGQEVTETPAKIWIPTITGSVSTKRTQADNFYVFTNTDGLTNGELVGSFASDCRRAAGIIVSNEEGYEDSIKESDINFDDDDATLTTLALQDGYYYGSLQINLWIEGWDANCTNTMLKDTFYAKLAFKGIPNSYQP